MTRRLILVSCGFALLAPTLLAAPAIADDFFVFAVKVSLPVHQVSGGVVVKRTLKEKDVVNLALGRPLGTKVDKEREILAVAAPYFPEDFEDGHLIVFDPSQNGLAQVTTVVADSTDVDREYAVLANGTAAQGVVTGEVEETTLGNPAQSALHATTLWTSGNGKETNHKGSAKGVVAGRVSFTNNGTAFSGFIVNGKVKVAVKLIGLFSDGNTGTPGCGDGIIQPGLGEECEFNMQQACPGDCEACICVVCGNNRIDPGEICDHTALGVCSSPLLFNPTGCKANCSGCSSCGDGQIDGTENCDTNLLNQCPGSVCLSPQCRCQ